MAPASVRQRGTKMQRKAGRGETPRTGKEGGTCFETFARSRKDIWETVSNYELAGRKTMRVMRMHTLYIEVGISGGVFFMNADKRMDGCTRIRLGRNSLRRTMRAYRWLGVSSWEKKTRTHRGRNGMRKIQMLFVYIHQRYRYIFVWGRVIPAEHNVYVVINVVMCVSYISRNYASRRKVVFLFADCEIRQLFYFSLFFSAAFSHFSVSHITFLLPLFITELFFFTARPILIFRTATDKKIDVLFEVA